MGNQCNKALYLNKKHPELKAPFDDSQLAIMNMGTSIGELAQQRFPGGIDASPDTPYEYQKAVIKTREYIQSGHEIIYEACFQHEDVLCALDILVKNDGKWYAYEVKGSTEVKDYHITDTSLQYHVITNSGIELEDIFVMHLNNKYVRKGDLDLNILFTASSVKEKVVKNQIPISKKIKELKDTLKLTEIPQMKVGAHCFSPFDCSFQGYCWKDIPEENSINVLSSKIYHDLLEKEIYTIDEIPENYKLDGRSLKKLAKLTSTETIVEKKPIKEFLDTFEYPLYYFDFETYMMGVPAFDELRPYQQIPFQYSLHIQREPNSPIEHKEFLGDGENDPRLDLIKQLIDEIGTTGSVVCYNVAFERSRLKELGENFPIYQKQLSSIIDRLVDLMVPFQKLWYYHPEFKASYSIKAVLPALIPEFSYDNLNIHNGGEASSIYPTLSSMTKDEKTNVIKDLLAYCELDTLAMVKIYDFLHKSVNA
jgi:predicted RecB family nuclease